MYISEKEIKDMIDRIECNVKETLHAGLESFKDFIFNADNLASGDKKLYEIDSGTERKLCYDLIEAMSETISSTLEDGGPSCSPCVITRKQFDDYSDLTSLRRHVQSLLGLKVTW